MYNKPSRTYNEEFSLNYYVDNVLNLMCNYDEKRKEYLLNWLAYVLQYPERRNHTAIEIVTTQGTGKNFIFNIIADYLGEYGNINGNIEDLYASFNSILADKKLIIFNECPKTKKDLGALKSFITEDRIQIKGKYIPEYITDNLTNVIILSNHFDTNTIEDNDRRFTFFYSTLKPFDKTFYDEAYEDYEQIKTDFINFLLSRDLTDYSPNKTYDDDDKKLIYENRKTNRNVIYKLIDYIFKNDTNRKELSINDLNELISSIKMDEDKSINDERLYDEIHNEPIPLLTNKTINNLLQYNKTDDYYLDYNTIKRKITDYDDVYEYINQVKEISLKDLKEKFNQINNNNYNSILSGYDIIDNGHGSKLIKVHESYDEVFEYIDETLKETNSCLLKDIMGKYKYIKRNNYKTILGYKYEIKKTKKGMTLSLKIDIDDY